jgi:hypothetical protein
MDRYAIAWWQFALQPFRFDIWSTYISAFLMVALGQVGVIMWEWFLPNSFRDTNDT